jgi:anti-sigma factor RsiW
MTHEHFGEGNRVAMNCRAFQELADSFLGEELLTETNHEMLRHLDICPSCRREIDGRRRLRRSLQVAFDRAPELQPRADFAVRLREQLREATVHDGARRLALQRWLALAAGVLLAAGVAGLVLMKLSPSVDALARDARGDHWYCALKNRVARTPMPLEEAAQRFDSSYRLLMSAPPDDISTPGGVARVIDRHSCAFGTRRFGHVILQYQGRVVSLLLTAHDDQATGGVADDSTPYVHGQPVNGLSVVSVRGARHAILLVGDLEERELTQLSRTVAVPLARQLEGSLIVPGPPARAALNLGGPIGDFAAVFLRR